MKLTLEGGEEEVFLLGGFLEVQPGEVTLLTDVAERADDIDSAAAERAKELAERELEDQRQIWTIQWLQPTLLKQRLD